MMPNLETPPISGCSQNGQQIADRLGRRKVIGQQTAAQLLARLVEAATTRSAIALVPTKHYYD